jgi:hypothetical protein
MGGGWDANQHEHHQRFHTLEHAASCPSNTSLQRRCFSASVQALRTIGADDHTPPSPEVLLSDYLRNMVLKAYYPLLSNLMFSVNTQIHLKTA